MPIALVFVLQLAVPATYDLATALPFPVIAMQPVEADGDPNTVEWLTVDTSIVYRTVAQDTGCVSAPFHPDGIAPSLIARQTYPVYRVGRVDELVRLDVNRQTLTRFPLALPDCSIKR